MEYRRYADRIYLRLDKGDEVIESLRKLCQDEGINAACFEGIGGCDKAEVGIFDPEKKNYITHDLEGMAELVSLNGNVTFYEDAPYIHAHAVLAYHDEDQAAQTLSGHLLSARIGLTAEITLTPENARISRRYDEELGIRVWDFDT